MRELQSIGAPRPSRSTGPKRRFNASAKLNIIYNAQPEPYFTAAPPPRESVFSKPKPPAR